MVEFTKEDNNKLQQILKELNEMRNVLKGGEGSGVKGHKTPNLKRDIREGRAASDREMMTPREQNETAERNKLIRRLKREAKARGEKIDLRP